MQKTKIEWCDYTWNPVVGCKHGCSYCYARRMNNRFKWIPKWDEPQFFPERLVEPYKLKKPATIFVGSICDLFGEWIPREWISLILNVAKDLPLHTFMFLTKNPVKYVGFLYAENIWLGATVEHKRFKRRIEDMKYVGEHKIAKTFISIEPILSDFRGVDMYFLNMVIVGADSSIGAKKPKQEWLDNTSIVHPNIFYKDNIKLLVKEKNL